MKGEVYPKGMEPMTIDLATLAFMALRNHLFNSAGQAIPFSLRPKQNTQADPFDEYLTTRVFAKLEDVQCEKAPGPLITPDMVLFRRSLCLGMSAGDLCNDTRRIISIEVKKLERTHPGSIARASGLDYNTTPPCGRARVYDAKGQTLDIRSFYLFVCIESYPIDTSQVVVSALALVDGNILNTDFSYYLSIIGHREKEIGLGSYGDGADRKRPMVIFSNPLGAKELDRKVSLVHPDPGLDSQISNLRLVYQIERTLASGGINHFYCYRVATDVAEDWAVRTLKDPFPTPTRDVKTQPRGRFRLSFPIH